MIRFIHAAYIVRRHHFFIDYAGCEYSDTRDRLILTIV